MDFDRPAIFIPLEKELLPYKLKHGIKNLSREELEVYTVAMSELLVKLTYQSRTLLQYIEALEGKLEEVS
jgi:hypothetical protein